MSCRSSNNLGKPMKVVHIKTQYVETDACSFKSVVQNLTGKNSTIADSPSSSWVMKVKNEINNNEVAPSDEPRLGFMTYADDRRARPGLGLPSSANSDVVLECHQNNINNNNNYNNNNNNNNNNFNEDCIMSKGGGGSYSFLSRNLSYKEMDRLMELPPLDELHKLLSFD